MKRILVLLLACLILCGCAKNEEYVDRSFVAMDTIIDIRISDSELDEEAIIAECERLITDIESVISKTVADSDTEIANTGIDLMLAVSGAFSELVSRSSELSRLTDGSFDITVGALKELWENSAKEGRAPSEDEIASCLENVGYNGISIEDGTLKKSSKDIRIDFGAIGKGYAAEKVCELLREKGVSGAILSFGGNVALVGEKKNGEPYKVGIKDPKNPDDVIGYLDLEGGYVSVSGDYERYIEIGETKYNHIIDPKTGYPVSNGLHSVSVVSNDGALSDALSTALFVMGKEASFEFYNSGVCDFEAVFVTDDGIFATAGLEGGFSAKKGVTVTFEGEKENGN